MSIFPQLNKYQKKSFCSKFYWHTFVVDSRSQREHSLKPNFHRTLYKHLLFATCIFTRGVWVRRLHCA